MDAYSFCLILGAAGLGIMAVSGLAHHSGGHHAGGHGDSQGAGHGHSHDAGHSHSHDAGHSHSHAAHHGYAHSAHHGGGAAGHWHVAETLTGILSSLASPRVIFSLLVGFGAAGMLVRGMVAAPLIAVAGGIAFESLLVGPLWRFLFRFESKPALTLESSITDEVTALTGFNANGEGLVTIELDGQMVQLLGVLSRVDRDAAVRVRAGDRLRVEDVDGARNRCTVSYLGR